MNHHNNNQTTPSSPLHSTLPLPHRPIADILTDAPRFLFFTGKGGVGKTSIACATALALADSGRQTLLVSTDPASNLDQVLGLELARTPRPVPSAPTLSALNINPAAAAAAYRERIIGPMRGLLPEPTLREMEEQLSGACTMEIAAFDEFTEFLAADGADAATHAHIVFDTAPTGHTLRLMALSQAWTGFLNHNTSGQSCLGPLAGLEKQRSLYSTAVDVLKDHTQTRVILVSRPQPAALREARRTAQELENLAISNQCLAINGWFTPTHPDDDVSAKWAEKQSRAIATSKEFLASKPLYLAPLLSDNLVGLDILRAFFRSTTNNIQNGTPPSNPSNPSNPSDLADLAEELAASGRGVILTMGKGGVGKTTIAAALALALAERGANVLLSTTDPAAHLQDALNGETGTLQIERIDPQAETEAYTREVLASQPDNLDPEAKALIEEDLRSPCTTEIAVFRAFARTVAHGDNGFVVLDTAPTGHTLLLLDATQAYHRELGRQSRSPHHEEAIANLLPRLRDPAFTRILLVTLAETTPVREAADLQDDLRRAGIEPQSWIINQSLADLTTADPILAARSRSESKHIQEILQNHSRRKVYAVDWSPLEPIGRHALLHLIHHHNTTTTNQANQEPT